ncbi:PIR Superfamily Protein [Plasmodium ovale wallikeri]|uniref:PIR Superfamily Protein n=1 Tax=Plasmodium ovale wallikeri TaxID=864142 RepID=A0A1A9ASK2_PLAOA|nr:PIR Superfamily Protein [Plasmodium ovale wallikeri]
MPKPPDSTNFSELFQKSSKELNSEKFYDALNNVSLDLSKYQAECKNINVRSLHEQMAKFCEKYLSYLESCEALNNKNFCYDVSKLMNYWLYDEITNIYGNENTTEIGIAFGALQFILGYPKYNPKLSSLIEKCKPNLKMVNHHDWKNRKDLYDYCINYKFIEDECKFYPEECKRHCDYIGKQILGILKCPEKNTVPKAFFQEGDGMHRPQEQGLRTAAGSHDTEPKPETSNIGTKVGHSVLGVAPVLLSATALYRYTPVGSWVCKLSGYSPNSVSNMDEGVVEGILGNTQETDDILFSNTGNYISYKPI